MDLWERIMESICIVVVPILVACVFRIWDCRVGFNVSMTIACVLLIALTVYWIVANRIAEKEYRAYIGEEAKKFIESLKKKD